MEPCKVCGKVRLGFVFNNHICCLQCDELLFDIEIECEGEERKPLALESKDKIGKEGVRAAKE